MALSERDARERVNNALSDIRETAASDAEAARAALVRALALVARNFNNAARKAIREGRPLDPTERARVRTLVMEAITTQSSYIIESGRDAEAFVDFVVASLLATHVGIVTANFGADAGRRARDDFLNRVRQVPQNTQDAVRRLRWRDLEIPQLVGTYASAAITSAQRLLDSEIDSEVNSEEVTNDLYLLLLGQDISYGKYDLEQSDLTGLRGMTALGATVVVAETFNAMREGSWRTMASLGLVQTARWTLSARHAGLSSSPDECDAIAGRDVGFGPGRYLLNQWPASPHPHCGCYASKVGFQNYQGWLTRYR